MNSRLKALVKQLKSRKLDSILINSDHNIRYLTRFPASESWLFVTAKGKSYYITDSRYTLEAKAGLKGSGTSVVEYKKSFYLTLNELITSHKVRSLGIDQAHYTISQYIALRKQRPKSCKICPANQLVEDLRIIKDPGEVKAIKSALKIHAKALKYLKRIVKSGVTEYDILLKLEAFVRSHHCGFSFDPIVASGSNSCLPHAAVSRRKIRKNDVVLVDMGIDQNGYKSDLTRMFFLGKIPNLVRRTNEIVYQAQRQAIASIKPGVSAKHVDQQARKYLANNKLDKYFGHSLGHGVGLEIHEAPRLSPQSSTKLKPGMVVTVEPGVYLPGKFGIRIEDMVLVTDRGCEILSDNID